MQYSSSSSGLPVTLVSRGAEGVTLLNGDNIEAVSAGAYADPSLATIGPISTQTFVATTHLSTGQYGVTQNNVEGTPQAITVQCVINDEDYFVQKVTEAIVRTCYQSVVALHNSLHRPFSEESQELEIKFEEITRNDDDLLKYYKDQAFQIKNTCSGRTLELQALWRAEALTYGRLAEIPEAQQCAQLAILKRFSQLHFNLREAVIAKAKEHLQQLVKKELAVPGTPHKSKGAKVFNEAATEILRQWFSDHILNPYPSKAEKQELARLCGVQMSKVTMWFCNMRTRVKKEHATKSNFAEPHDC
ncbi:pre-B-cell leukemia transcription factor 1 [Pelomyxa schiedti]|nr:pre-B-cell leukemia transcription factor 1 [Pelomyxa schiedti]